MSKNINKILTLEQHIKAKNIETVPSYKYTELIQKYKEHDKARTDFMRKLEKENKNLREELNKLRGERNKAINEKEAWAIIGKLEEEKEQLIYKVADLEIEIKKQKNNLNYYISRAAQLENKLKFGESNA